MVSSDDNLAPSLRTDYDDGSGKGEAPDSFRFGHFTCRPAKCHFSWPMARIPM